MIISVRRMALASLLLCAAPYAHAQKKYGMAGCGLGSLVIDPAGSQTSAATTNGTAFSQLFGISSGTSNCRSASETAMLQRQEEFMVINLNSLSKEMAQGQGETLAAFTSTLGCDDAAFPMVAAHLQSEYSMIFKAPGAMAVLDASKASLKANQNTSGHCRYL